MWSYVLPSDRAEAMARETAFVRLLRVCRDSEIDSTAFCGLDCISPKISKKESISISLVSFLLIVNFIFPLTENNGQ